jgi:hypothetical protein
VLDLQAETTFFSGILQPEDGEAETLVRVGRIKRHLPENVLRNRSRNAQERRFVPHHAGNVFVHRSVDASVVAASLTSIC